MFSQIVYGAVFGIVVAYIALWFLSKYKFVTTGYDVIFIVAVALVSFAAPSLFGGNGYLSAYITGIILGNKKISNKQSLVHFFDIITGFMQILLFFLLGLLSFPSQLPQIATKGLLIVLFLTFVSRPIAVFFVLTPFKSKFNQQLLVSWAGMRGAASIVFAMLAVVDSATVTNDIFHIVFFIVLFSILLQGSLLPFFSKKLNMIDDRTDVMRTFNDYIDEVAVQFIQFTINNEHPWSGKEIKDIVLPPDCLLVLLVRNGKKIVPNGSTRLEENDSLILSGMTAEQVDGVNLYEKIVSDGDCLSGRRVREVPAGEKLLLMIKRGNKVIIPKGNTIIHNGDLLVVNDPQLHRTLTD